MAVQLRQLRQLTAVEHVSTSWSQCVWCDVVCQCGYRSVACTVTRWRCPDCDAVAAAAATLMRVTSHCISTHPSHSHYKLDVNTSTFLANMNVIPTWYSQR